MIIVQKALAAMPGAPDLSIGKPENVAITNIGTLIQGAVQEARDRITAALVGLAVVASAWAIMLIISYFFGIDILSGNITPPKAY